MLAGWIANDLTSATLARFGEIAVGEGYITEEQLDVLLKKQGSTSYKEPAVLR